MTAQARVEPPTPLSSYARALAASSAGADERASAGYAAAIAQAPDNEVIAGRALSHAVTAGDWPLALRAASILERREAMPPDARFLLVAAAFRDRDWTAARRQLDAIEGDELFAFTVPVMRAWLAQGAGEGDPLEYLSRPQAGAAETAYAAEHRPLLMLAAGRPGGRQLLADAIRNAGPRGLRLRLAGAATLARRGDREGALALLEGEESAIGAARAAIEAGRPLPGAVDGAAAGLGELLVRLSLDLVAEDLTPLAIGLARLATYAAPDNGQAWMVTAELLAREGRHDAAVSLLESVTPADPLAMAARDQRIRMLVEAGQSDRALAEAEAAAGERAGVADLVRYGELLIERGRPADGAAVFARALELRRRGDATYPEWALWLFRGGAYDEAGDWPQARAALERAYSLAPDQPLVLNYLGYAQLERRENLAEAERLVREAHRMAPNNPAITDSLGWALFLKGEVNEAIPLLERAAEGEPADVEINEHLGDAYFSAGRRIEARFAWAAARVYAEGEDAARLDAKMQTGLTPQLAAR